jgi:hypothetical protein
VQRSQRLGKNEALFREVNERIRETSGRLVAFDGDVPLEFVCECSDVGCNEPVELTLAEYEAVRSDPTYFLVAPGHVWKPEVEQVVRERDGYAIIEKLGEARDVAVGEDGS